MAFGGCQTFSTLALSKALKLSQHSLVTALWKVSLLIRLGLGGLIGKRPSVPGVEMSQGKAHTLTLSSYAEAVKQVDILYAMAIGSWRSGRPPVQGER